MVVREIVLGRILSLWNASLRVKRDNRVSCRTQTLDPVTARFYSLFGTVNAAIFESLPFAGFVIGPHVIAYVTGSSAVSVIVSVVMGLLAASASGLALIDFRSRFWKEAASSYDHVYRTGSEVMAFAVAWCSIAHNIALTSATVRACSQSLNYMLEQRLTILTQPLLRWVPTCKTCTIDVLAFLLYMIVWAVVALRLSLPLGRRVVLAGNAMVLVVFGVITVVAGVTFKMNISKEFGDFFPSGYTGIASGAAVFYLAFNVFENLSKFVEYSSPRSYKLHLKSSLLAVVVLGLVLTGSTTTISLISSKTNFTTEQPLSESFEGSDFHLPGKFFLCVTSMIFLIPGVFIQFERCLAVLDELVDDGLFWRGFDTDKSSLERSILACIGIGLIGAAGSACLNIVILCQIAAIGILVKHLLVLVTVVTIKYRPQELVNHRLRTEIVENRERSSHSVRFCEEPQTNELYYFSISNLSDHKSLTHNSKDSNDIIHRRAINKDQPSSDEPNPSPKRALLTESSQESYRSDDFEDNKEVVQPDLRNQSKPSSISSGSDDDQEELNRNLECISDTDIDAIVEDYLRNMMKSPSLSDLNDLTNEPGATETTYHKAILSIVVFVVSSLVLVAILTHAHNRIHDGDVPTIVAVVVDSLILITAIVFIFCQPTEPSEEDQFKLKDCHLVCVFMAAIFLNSVLLVAQPLIVPVVFGCWAGAGLTVYMLYGIHHSKQSSLSSHLPDEQRSLLMRDEDSHNSSHDRTPFLNSDALSGNLDDSISSTDETYLNIAKAIYDHAN